MSLEDDIFQAIEIALDNRKKVTEFVGRVQSIDPPLVIMDGTSVPIPCLAAQHVTLVADTRVVVNLYGSEYVVMAVLA